MLRSPLIAWKNICYNHSSLGNEKFLVLLSQATTHSKTMHKGAMQLGLATARRRCGTRVGRSRRRLGLEQLESRRLLIAEGDVFTLTRTVDAAGLAGNVAAVVDWGDGTTSSAEVNETKVTSNLRFQFDYSLDTRGFFSGANSWRRGLLEFSGRLLTAELTDELTAIIPTSTNQWQPNIRHPSTGTDLTGQLHQLPASLRVPANTIIVYVGARDLPGNVRGFAGPGGASYRGSQAWLDNVTSRGQRGALGSQPTDFAPNVGSVSFDLESSTDWYFGYDADQIGASQIDFVSVAVHELAHVLGFGTAPSWQRLVENGRFGGTRTNAIDPSSSNTLIDGNHWHPSVVSRGGFKPLLAGQVNAGVRSPLTALDFAGLDDLGWQVANQNVTISAAHRFANDGDFSVKLALSGNVDANVVGERLYPLGSVKVTNVPPDLVAVSDQTVTAGVPLSIRDLGRISDPGTKETFEYVIDWGDGSPPEVGSATIDRLGNLSGSPTQASFDGRHVYALPGANIVTVRVTDDDGGTNSKTFVVTVLPKPGIELALDRTIVTESDGAGAALLQIKRTGAGITEPLTVSLQSSDESEIGVPAEVVIPASQNTVSVPIHAVDDALLDGDVNVRLTAQGAGLDPQTIDLLVRDQEQLAARFARNSIVEDQAAGIELIVRRSNTDVSNPQVVVVQGGLPGEIRQPQSITIPAGQQETTVALLPIDDSAPELTQQVKFNFSAVGYAAATAAFELLDDEPPAFQNPDDPFDVQGNDGLRASDALRVINELARRNRNGSSNLLDPDREQPNGVYVDVNGDYRLTALDALRVINELSRRGADGQRISQSQQILASHQDDKRVLAEANRLSDLPHLF
jgi:hypothetical protein